MIEGCVMQCEHGWIPARGKLFLLCLLPVISSAAQPYEQLNLPPKLLEYKIRNDKVLLNECLEDPNCPFEVRFYSTACIT